MQSRKRVVMNEKIPPHSTEAEKSVLGACMTDEDVLMNILEILKPEDFYSEAHKEIFKVIHHLYHNDEPVDSLMVTEELKKRKSLEAVSGRTYIMSLADDVPTTANSIAYAKIVSEKAVLRRLIKAANKISDHSYQEKIDPQEVLDRAEQEIFEIGQGRQKKDYISLQETLGANIDTFEQLEKNEGSLTGLNTGFLDLNEKTAGLQKSNLIVVAARPGMGKTAFALNLALNVAKKDDASVLIFNFEMDHEEIGQRLISIETMVEMQKLKTGKLKSHDWGKIHLGIDELSKVKIHIDDTPAISIMEMKNKCRRLKADKGLDLIIVDYLQLMTYEGKADNRQQEVSALSRTLKLLAREMDCPVILLSQLSRSPDQRTDHHPMLSDLRESGAIEQDADIVIFLYRDEVYNEETDTPGMCEVMIAKHRSGPTGKVELTWMGQYSKFSNIRKSNENLE